MTPDESASPDILHLDMDCFYASVEVLEDPSLKASKIADSIGISESHLHATMKKHGATVGSAIILRRLERCAQDLASPRFREARITDIAFGRGFSDGAHFSRCFKARFGCSPTQFRESGRSL